MKECIELAEIFQLRVTCRWGQVISVSIDCYALGEGARAVVKYEVFSSSLFLFSLKISPEGNTE